MNALLGAWLVAIPFLFADLAGMGTGFAFWNYLLVGGGILLLSGYNWWIADETHPGTTWAPAASALLGAWVIVVPFLTEVAAGGWLLWNDVIVGALVVVIGAYNAYEASEVNRERLRTTT